MFKIAKLLSLLSGYLEKNRKRWEVRKESVWYIFSESLATNIGWLQ
jgi:hypothetical protein